MNVDILKSARLDLIEGYYFYERQRAGLGDYFLESLGEDIESLAEYAGIHEVVLGYHQTISEAFPYVIYYRVRDDRVIVHAVIDGRRDPDWIAQRLAE
jgi:hypothetical protein